MVYYNNAHDRFMLRRTLKTKIHTAVSFSEDSASTIALSCFSLSLRAAGKESISGESLTLFRFVCAEPLRRHLTVQIQGDAFADCADLSRWVNRKRVAPNSLHANGFLEQQSKGCVV